MTEAEVSKYLDNNPDLNLTKADHLKKFKIYAKDNNQLECDIARWVIDNKSGLIRKILLSHNSAYHLFPSSFIDIYLDNYADNVLTIIKREIQATNFNLNPEEISLIVTQDWLTMLLGHKFFIPPK